MKTISLWARHHAFLARTFIICCELLLFAGAVYTGILLEGLGVGLSPLLFAFAVILLSFFAFFYPALKRKKLRIHARYVRQKVRIVGLIVATYVCVCFLFNTNSRVRSFVNVTTLQGSFITSKDSSKSAPATQFSKKELRKELRWLLKNLKRDEPEDRTGKVIGIILVILGGAILTFLVAALSCSIACAGSEALAILVAALGITGIAFLVAWAIKSIIHGKKKAVPETTNP